MRRFIGNGDPVNTLWENLSNELLDKGGIMLDVGCGAEYKVDSRLIGVDAYEDSEEVNVQAFMWDMPFADNSVDAIFCWQVLEHVTKFHIVPTLQEFGRVLKPGGRALILVPDLEWVIRNWLYTPTNGYPLDQIFGLQTGPGQEHKTGFSQDIFAAYIFSVPELELIRFIPVKAYAQLNIGAVIDKREST
jgi:SAM-dependent methyltransferase